LSGLVKGALQGRQIAFLSHFHEEEDPIYHGESSYEDELDGFDEGSRDYFDFGKDFLSAFERQVDFTYKVYVYDVIERFPKWVGYSGSPSVLAYVTSTFQSPFHTMDLCRGAMKASEFAFIDYVFSFRGITVEEKEKVIQNLVRVCLIKGNISGLDWLADEKKWIKFTSQPSLFAEVVIRNSDKGVTVRSEELKMIPAVHFKEMKEYLITKRKVDATAFGGVGDEEDAADDYY